MGSEFFGLASAWFAIKELKLSYHNMEYIVNDGFPLLNGNSSQVPCQQPRCLLSPSICATLHQRPASLTGSDAQKAFLRTCGIW